MADTERKLGAVGTVEHAYRVKDSKPFDRGGRPRDMGASTVTMAGSAPNAIQRKGKARHARQNPEPQPRKVKGGGKALWAQYLGNSREGKYGIRVKVRGCEASDYWVPYAQAANLWYEITGLDLSEVVT